MWGRKQVKNPREQQWYVQGSDPQTHTASLLNATFWKTGMATGRPPGQFSGVTGGSLPGFITHLQASCSSRHSTSTVIVSCVFVNGSYTFPTNTEAP